MELINDLSSDLVFAVLVENKHRQKIGLREAKSLIARVESELLGSAARRLNRPDSPETEPTLSPLFH